MTPFRASEAAAVDLSEASRQYVKAVAALNHDSAGYVLVSTNAQQFHVADQDVANVKRVYQTSLTERNSVREKLRHAIATKDDTTRLGYQLTHTFRAKTEAGKLMLDSAKFLVNLHGVVLPSRQAHNFPFYTDESNRDFFMGIAPPLPPPPPPMAPPTPSQVRAYLKEPMQR